MNKFWLIIFSGFLSLVLLVNPVWAARYDHGMPGIYNISPFTLSDGEGSGLSTDVNGNIIISPSSTISLSSSTTISASISATSTLNVTQIFPSTSSTLTYLFDNSSSTVNVKGSSGRFHGMVMDNASGSKLYIQLHNSTSAPALGAAPVISIPINSGSQMIMDASYFQFLQKYFSTGIELVISDTFRTSTPSASYGSVNVMVEYD